LLLTDLDDSTRLGDEGSPRRVAHVFAAGMALRSEATA
jgi:hypothetical protein